LNDRAPLTRNLDGLQRKAIRRRRAAVLAADVVGYVRLMDDYEEATHLRVMALRRLVVDPFVRGHEGRVVKNTGDGFLAEFGDVHDALQCALAIQRTVAKNGTVAGNATVCYRMGLHCGPVIVEPEDVYGHVVNLAARLQTLAPPGRVVVSATARAEIERAAREVVFLDYGVHAVKNVRESVQAYVVVPSSYGEPAYR
jgi:class 3 adenylate cyclase